MRLDLTKDKRKIITYLKRRVKDYPKYVNVGPGEDADPVRMIALGFYAAQSGYISLNFDTRPDADYDGEYTRFLEDETMLYLPKWCDFYDQACEGEPVTLVTKDGISERIQFEHNDDECCDEKFIERLNAYFGDLLKDVLTELKEDGTWAKLPLDKKAFMMVIEFDENYLWPKYPQRKTKGRVGN